MPVRVWPEAYEYGKYQKIVKNLLLKFENNEISYNDFKNKLQDTVKELEKNCESLQKDLAGADL